MKTIRIAHLYYDLMNLYGETGNILALKMALKRQNVRFEVDELTKGCKIDFSKYEIFIMGCGTEENQEIVRKDIIRYKEEFKKYVKIKTFIITGNALELFGTSINNKEALQVFNFKAKGIRKRIVGEQVYKTYLFQEPVIGFQNRGSIHDNKENHLFEIISGNADNQSSKFEGIKVNHFYGTYLLGPLLIRNPKLTNTILKELFEAKKYPFKEILDTPEEMAYEAYLKNFLQNKNVQN